MIQAQIERTLEATDETGGTIHEQAEHILGGELDQAFLERLAASLQAFRADTIEQGTKHGSEPKVCETAGTLAVFLAGVGVGKGLVVGSAS